MNREKESNKVNKQTKQAKQTYKVTNCKKLNSTKLNLRSLT
jgi:hypothetical protein